MDLRKREGVGAGTGRSGKRRHCGLDVIYETRIKMKTKKMLAGSRKQTM